MPAFARRNGRVSREVPPDTQFDLVAAAAAVAGAGIVSHGGWLCGCWEGEGVGVVVVVLRSGEIRVSCVEIPQQRKDAATPSMVERPFSELQSSI